jgi:ankyrin repeat protein
MATVDSTDPGRLRGSFVRSLAVLVIGFISIPPAAFAQKESRFCDAVQHGDLALLRRLVKKSPKIVNQPCLYGRMPLENAALEGRADVVRFLVERGADIHARNSNGATAIFMAARSGNDTIVRYLLANGASPRDLDFRKQSPLFRAGSPAIAAILIEEGIPLNDADSSGVTPLLSAVMGDRSDVAGYLLDRGAAADSYSNNGEIPLHYAAKKGNTLLVRLLLEHGADPGIRDRFDNTPLHMAKRAEIAALLLENGARADAANGAGFTPICVVNADVATVLLAHGADPILMLPNGSTPMHPARIDMINLARSRTLIDHGARVDALDRSGATPLLAVARCLANELRKRSDALARIEEVKRKMDSSERADPNPMFMEPPRVDTARARSLLTLLLDSGAAIDAKLPDGRTALHILASTDDTATVGLLLARGASPKVRDLTGRTPLEYALEAHRKDVATLLSAHGGK